MYLSLAKKSNILSLSGIIVKGESKLIQHTIRNLYTNMLALKRTWLMSQSTKLSLKL